MALLDLENFSLGVPQIVISLGFIAVFVLWYLGVFSRVEVSEDVFYGGVFIYKDWRGPISQVGQAFGPVMADVAEFRSNEPRKFSLPMMGIYYDDPQNLKDASMNRASIGVLL